MAVLCRILHMGSRSSHLLNGSEKRSSELFSISSIHLNPIIEAAWLGGGCKNTNKIHTTKASAMRLSQGNRLRVQRFVIPI